VPIDRGEMVPGIEFEGENTVWVFLRVCLVVLDCGASAGR